MAHDDVTHRSTSTPSIPGNSFVPLIEGRGPFLIIAFDSTQKVFSRNAFDDRRVLALEGELFSLSRAPSARQLWRLSWIACCSCSDVVSSQELLPIVFGCRFFSVVCIVLRCQGRDYAKFVLREYALASVAGTAPASAIHASSPLRAASRDAEEISDADRKFSIGDGGRKFSIGAQRGGTDEGKKEYRKSAAKKVRQTRREEEGIDEMFADLETAVKYLGKVLYLVTQPVSSVWVMLRTCIPSLLGILTVLIFCLTIVLPTFFAVLVVRMLKVEVTKESFVHRAAIIAAETATKHTLRISRLLLRAMPMMFSILIYPWILLQIIIVDLATDAQRTACFSGIAGFLAFIVILQLQGTVRAALTFQRSLIAREQTQRSAAMVIQRWWQLLHSSSRAAMVAVLGLDAMQQHSHVGARFFVPLNPDFIVPSFHDKSPQFGVSFFFPEFVPMALVLPSQYRKFLAPPSLRFVGGVQLPKVSWFRDLVMLLSLLIEAMQLSALSLRVLPKINWFDHDVLPVFFVRPPSPTMSLFWMSIATVASVVLLTVGRMMYEIRRYEELQHTSDRSKAEAFFFHSFVGSLLYGHGQPEHLPGTLCGVVSLICDTLFFALVDNLSSVMVCFTRDEIHIADTSVACWNSAHRLMCTASMMAVGYFVPLSILVAPVLAEANRNSKRVGFVKPYLMCVNLAKVVAIMSMVLLSSRALPCILVAFSLCAFIAWLTIVWACRTASTQPSTSPCVNVVRFLFACGAMVCSFVAFVVFVRPEWNTSYKYIFVISALVSFDVALPGLCVVRGVPSCLIASR